MIVDKVEAQFADAQVFPSEKAYGSRELPQLPQEQPPPYAEGSRGPANRPDFAQTHSIFQSPTQQHVNFITLESKHNTIAGSYIINPDLPGSSTAHTRMLERRDKKRLRHNIVPNATFKTRHGAVNVNLATAGNNDQLGKAYVQIVTRHGKVNVNLFALQSNKNICLELATRHAPITLLIPPNFRGMLRFSSKRGNIQFLKTFAEQSRVVFADDKHADVLFGPGDLSQVEPTSEGTDYVSLTSRHGRITVGVCGADPIDTTSGGGLVKKLGELVMGTDLMRNVVLARADLMRARFASLSSPQGPTLGPHSPHQPSA